MTRWILPLAIPPLLAAAIPAVAAPPGPVPQAWTEPRTEIEFVRLPAGKGAPPFSIGRTEVTQRQWRTVMGGDPSHHAGCDDCPVEQVSWDDAREFLRRAGEAAGVRLRLPTEAEWEHAASAGGAHARWPGTDDPDELVLYVWSKGRLEGRSRPVGQKRGNAFGLHDLGGNVAEWCEDRFGTEAGEGERRAVRGGSFVDGPDDVLVGSRRGASPAARRRTIGFRAAADGG